MAQKLSSITKKPMGVHAPLSLAQQRLWFLFTLNPSSTLYNISRAWRLRGILHSSALGKTLQTILDRHEALRTIVQEIDGQPVQIIMPTPLQPVIHTDVSSCSKIELDREIEGILGRERTRPFDLRQGPLIRFHLLRCGLDDHVFLMIVHHIVFDGWSLLKFCQELSGVYTHTVRNEESSLSSLPIQYGDFSYWQHQEVASDRFPGELAYWKSQLNGIPHFLELPTDFPRQEFGEEHEGYHRFSIPAQTLEKLKHVSQREGVTLFMTLLGAFHTLLAMYSGQKDIVVGTPAANRNRVELEPLLGFFVNLLPLRINLSKTRSFRDVLAQVRQVCLEAYRHSELPFEYLVEMLNLPRDSHRHPVVQVIFQLRKAEDIQLSLPGLSATHLPVTRRTGNFDLHVVCEEVASTLQGYLYYPQNLFSEESMVRFAAHYQALLEKLVEDPDKNIWHVSILSSQEQDRMLREWNHTQADSPQDVCLHERFEAQVGRTADAIAVVYEDEALTYASLNRRANHLAHHLRSLGIRPESVVAVAVERSIHLLVALLATLKAGAAYLPLDMTYPRERLAFMLKNANVSVLLTQQHVLTDWPQEPIHTLYIDTHGGEPTLESVTNPQSGVLPANLAYVIYTSGSTGQPKGVMIPHRGLLNYLTWCIQAYDIREGGEAVVHTSMAFDLTVTSLYASLLVGGTVRLLCESHGLDHLVALLRSDRDINLLKMTPSHLEAITHLVRPEEITSRIRTVVLGGEALFDHKLALWKHQTPRPNIINEYGPTETVVGCCVYQVIQESRLTGSVPIGRPISNMQMYIFDENMNSVPLGVSGELYIGGVGLARGYQGQPDLTAERFLPHPHAKEQAARLYKTGDVARYRSDGIIDYLGRSDQQVKILGYRIELGEIKTVLSHHPAIESAVVICREDAGRETQLTAYVVPKDNFPIEPATLRAYFQTRLPDYMLPSVFMVLDVLPLTPNGKLDRRALPAPDKHRQRIAPTVTLRTLEEKLLADIWAATLNIPQVGLHDNFFSLGGHSLLATHIISQIRSVFSVTLPIRALFDHPTIKDLAKQLMGRLTNTPAEDDSKITRLAHRTHLPLSFTQERFWVLDSLHARNQGYYYAKAFRLKGTLHEQILRQCFQDIVNRHEILRTTFPSVDGHPRQIISPTWTCTMPVIERSNIADGDRESEAIRLLREEKSRPIDLAQGPVFHVKLVRFDPQDHLVILKTHHIIWDARSTEILLHELSRLYSAYYEGRAPLLPSLALQYSDFALWQRNHLEGPVGERELAYWRTSLEHVPPPLPIPTDFPRRPVQTFHGGQVERTLDQEFTKKILLFKQRTGSTFFMVTLATLQLLLSRYTGTGDILIGAPTAGRNRPEFETLIGCCLNNLVLRTQLSHDLTFAQLLRQVRKNVFGAMAHQEIPFEKLLDELHIERHAGRTPVFQVFLNMHNFMDDEVHLPGLATTFIPSDDVQSLFDWTLYFQEYPDRIHLKLVFRADLFAKPRMLETMNQLQHLLEQVVHDPDLPLQHYSLFTRASSRLLPDPTLPIEEPPHEDVGSLIRHQAERLSGHAAICQGKHTWSYQKLLRRSDALSQTFKALRLQSGEVVAVGGTRSFGLIVSLLAVLQTGGVILPLDPRLPVDRQRLMRQEAKAKRYVWIGKGFPQDFSEDDEPDTILLHVDPETGMVLDQLFPEATSSAPDFLPQPPEPSDPAYIFFTSGTTASPKGILGQHKSLSHFLKWQSQTFQIGFQDRIAQLTGLSFDAVLRDIFLPLMSGATLCLPDDQLELDPNSVIRWLEQERITILHAVPTVAQFWLRHVPEVTRLSSLRWTFFSGEPVTDVFVNHWRQSFPVSGQLVNFYGPTETTLIKTWYVIPDPPHIGIQPLGSPIPQTQALIVGHNNRLCGMGEMGEIVIRTPFRTHGYINAPSEQQRRFCQNPYRQDSSDQWYFTGDRGRYRLDGTLEFLGRIDNQIKIRGVRIEPEEITSILQNYQDLEATAVLGHVGKDSENVLVAYLVPKPNRSLTEQSLRKFLLSKVPSAMIPSSFVFLDSLPFTPNGKLDRRALPVPPVISSSRRTPFIEPCTPIEKSLAQILSDLFSIVRIGINDNFFELGGHSLLAMQVINRIETSFRRPFPLRQIFENPTIAEWAQYLEAVSSERQSSHMKSHSPQDREEGLL